MRVNHSGEVCAQALYQGQALTAKSKQIQIHLKEAAAEEIDHLAWCEDRLRDLGGRVSLLNPLWYLTSFSLGAFAGLLGDKVSLGFVAEVERQVEAHLASHLSQLPKADVKSCAVLAQMQKEEVEHADAAEKAGGMAFPSWMKKLMSWTSKGMTMSSYFI
jgi:ubiquinone biosynthesis monooxygenase Coq7